MSQKTYLNILKGGVLASFLVLFFVFDNLLFPYITSKQLPFNILIEVLTVFWLAFIYKFPNYRPRKSWLTIGLLAFLAALLVSSFTGVDFNMSFWGNIERMLGVFHLLHFLMFYLIIISVFRTKQDWLSLLMVSVAAATIESLYVMFGNAFGTFGNTSYVSGYMIFNIFFALILFFRQKNWGLRIYYVIAGLMMVDSMIIAGTRGAFVGLAFSILLLFFMLAMFNRNKKIKYGSLIGVAVFVLLVGLIATNANSGWVKNNRLFSRITQIDFGAVTFQTRLLSWKSAFEDFHNHPWLGTGYGNFAITFDKYFDPVFYDFSPGETYFDHAHNNLVDIASTSGVIGLIAYLSIFAALVYYLIKGFRQQKIGLVEFILLICLIVAYFIQNIVLFDSYVTYFSLMIMLGFVYWLAQGSEELEARLEATKHSEIGVLAVAALLMAVIFYQYSFRPLEMLTKTIEGQQAAAQGDMAGAINQYKAALSLNTPLDRQSRSSLIQLVLSHPELLNKLDKATLQADLDYVIQQGNKNQALNPQDSFTNMIMAELLNLTASFNTDNQQQFAYYSKLAEATIDKTIAATPGRIPVYFVKAQILMSRGENQTAVDIMKQAVSLNPKYADGQCQLAKTYFLINDSKHGYASLNQCLDLGGAGNFSPDQLGQYIDYYYKQKDLPRVITLFQQLTVLEPKEPKVWASLAEMYRQVGDKAAAISAANQAAELDPTLKSSAEQFIQKVGQ